VYKHGYVINRATHLPADRPASIPECFCAVRQATPESDILLQAIVITARKEQTRVTKGALRDLVRRFAHQYSLDF
jgi:hypothetical protein